MNPKLVSVLCVAVLILFLVPMVWSQDDSEDSSLVEYLVTGDSANVRAQPNTNSQVLDVVRSGESISINPSGSDVSGWLQVYRDGEVYGYIADFLVTRAPTRFYDPAQEPLLTVEGRGKSVTDVYEIPAGAYRVDAEVEDRAFILSYIVIEGSCRDDTIFNELNFDTNRLSISGLLVSRGCSVVFETDNVDSAWTFEVRDLFDPDYLASAVVEIEDGTQINGTGRSLTMATVLPEGIWEIQASVQSRAFILWAHPISDACRETAVLNEFGRDESLEISAVYRSGECIVFWETSNVDGEWVLTFSQIR